jgi:hypothetical protein
MPQGIEFFKCLDSGAFERHPVYRRCCQHLKLPRQIIDYHRTHGNDLIANQLLGGDVDKGGVIFTILEDGLLAAAAMVEQGLAFGLYALVVCKDLVVEIEILGLNKSNCKGFFCWRLVFLGVNMNRKRLLQDLGFHWVVKYDH